MVCVCGVFHGEEINEIRNHNKRCSIYSVFKVPVLMHIENPQKKNKVVFFGKLDKNWEIDVCAKSSKNSYFHDILLFQKWST
jgi:hypothetical protein